MQLINTSHKSPNHSSRNGTPISMLLIHASAGSFASALSWLCSSASKVSSHYLLAKNGAVYALVPLELAAWHAGRARHNGVTDLNACSVGIELANLNDGRDPYPPPQIDSAVLLCRTLIARFNIERGDVVRHRDVALPSGRKTDPAGLAWKAFTDRLYAEPYAGDTHYRVRRTVTGGATIRSAPRINGAVLGRLRAGDDFYGEPIEGNMVTIYGFGSSRVWARSSTMQHIWMGLLEKVT